MKPSVPDEQNKIKAVLYVEFDNSCGTKLSYQIPHGCLNEENFKSLQTYFIPSHRQMHDRLIVTKLSKYQTIGIPKSIPHSTASSGRDVSLFNIVFVTDLNAKTDPYKKILRKIISYFAIFEEEHQFLSCKENKPKIEDIIHSIYHGINTNGMCEFNVHDELNTIKLSYIDKESFSSPPVIRDSDVPIITVDLKDSDAWDLTLKELYPYLDNKRPIKLLADSAKIDITLVRKCIQSLIYYNLAHVVSPIQYSNTYYVTSSIYTIMLNPNMQQECRSYVRIDPDPKQLPLWEDIFTLYLAFQAGLKLKQLLRFEKPFERNINERRLIEYGLIRGILKKLHKYPILRPSATPVNSPNPCEDIPNEYKNYLNGQYSFDDICIILRYKLNKVEFDLETSTQITIIQKLGV